MRMMLFPSLLAEITSIDVYPLIKLKDTVYSPDQLSLLNIQMGDVQYE